MYYDFIESFLPLREKSFILKTMKTLKEIIHEGGIAVIKTDTLYGVVADARNPHAVDRVYQIKQRDLLKPVIVLVTDYDDIRSFGVDINLELKKVLDTYWPGKVSIILPTTDNSVDTHYIHKGTHGIAFRIPDDKALQKILRETGPLIAPSANPEKHPPAQNIQQAHDYFGDTVDYYLDGGDVTNTKPSKLMKISHTINIEVLRDE